MAILTITEQVPKVTAQGTQINFPNATCRLTMIK